MGKDIIEETLAAEPVAQETLSAEAQAVEEAAEETLSPEEQFKKHLPLSRMAINITFWITILAYVMTAFCMFRAADPLGFSTTGEMSDILLKTFMWIGTFVGCAGGCTLLYTLLRGVNSLTFSLHVWLCSCIFYEVVTTVLALFPFVLSKFLYFFVGIIILVYIGAGRQMVRLKGFKVIGWSFISLPILAFGGTLLSVLVGTDTLAGTALDVLAMAVAPCIPYIAIRDKCAG